MNKVILSSVTKNFINHFQIDSELIPDDLLKHVIIAFSQLPYENLTKIIKKEIEGSAQRSRREPHEVLQDHFDFGTGGTCFSLTQTLLHLLRSLGWKAEPILADRRYGINTHCALLVWIHDEPHLIDPGYLILKPLPLTAVQALDVTSGETCSAVLGRRPGGDPIPTLKGCKKPEGLLKHEERPLIKRDEMKVQTAFNELTLSPQAEGSKLDLCTVEKGRSTYRLTYKLDPVDCEEFFKVWDDSFHWNMMTYPLLTRVIGEEQIYLRGTRIQSRRLNHIEKSEMNLEDMIENISAQFGIHPSVVSKALSILKRQGELRG